MFSHTHLSRRPRESSRRPFSDKHACFSDFHVNLPNVKRIAHPARLIFLLVPFITLQSSPWNINLHCANPDSPNHQKVFTLCIYPRFLSRERPEKIRHLELDSQAVSRPLSGSDSFPLPLRQPGTVRPPWTGGQSDGLISLFCRRFDLSEVCGCKSRCGTMALWGRG